MSRTLWILAGVLLVIIGISALMSPGFVLGRPLASVNKEWSVIGNELRELQILGDGRVDIVFVESMDESQSVSVKGQVPDKVAEAIERTRLEGGRLVVDLRERRNFFPAFHFGFQWDEPEEVTVKLKPGYELTRLTVRTDSGNIQAGNIAVKTAEFSSDAAELKLADMTGSQIRVRADSGSLELENIDADELDIRFDAGNIQGSGITADTTVRVDTGNVELDGTAGKVNIRADSGNIRLIKKDTADADIRTDSGNVYVRLPASFAGSLHLKTDSGRIVAPETKNETQDLIQVRTDSGKIEIALDE